ncbi:polyketide biosynthesis enoyl-CoA hydratase PksI [Allocatelliglobosispora scoriae]|uniref:Polyketide biosynthesis enoyl-CoA hydratase PksI n=1 Tax=Allocatelliglobosispora scoriae TaxID=643052 RepID=A0A841BLA3_9ACTN|nr:polyketide synthase [Allocatelliglobosispora scoriae]MBB5867763.1 polyketide biosynthesis enoyl-CoA hydratase PksI [Allocatelliglobosispora scoriae]
MITFGPVRLTTDDHVATITLDDPDRHNRIDDPLTDGLRDAVAAAVADPGVRVVVLAGSPRVFCSGHSRDWLLAADDDPGTRQGLVPAVDFIRAPIDCPLPVVAAMEGSAAGGGFLLGMYADAAVLCERAVYSTIFMAYGFTPGMGSTVLLPRKLGHALGSELLYTGRGYTGRELRSRGAPLRVVPKAEVVPTALALAHRIAQAPRRSLEAVKHQVSAELRAATSQAHRAETQAQLETIALPSVQARVRDMYPETSGPLS